jgi:hypothetical protein
LKFVASRKQDAIMLTAGSGGSMRGKAWFEGVSLDEVSADDGWPTREAVQTFGPAYRYPYGGWIYLHIEPTINASQHYMYLREIGLHSDSLHEALAIVPGASWRDSR